jgi:hypothetical protein
MKHELNQVINLAERSGFELSVPVSRLADVVLKFHFSFAFDRPGFELSVRAPVAALDDFVD